ncbi:MAG: hypothetical protein EZS28_003290 [Streblomastix strix]|uniref:Uncharacterized protein n=1 Tax=Streblomastix strix TaxID=222440 RepID=A0A5J4X1U0_9EUKA|nr:MAG: hypothetical protein EZS28_003290 [Streblomastix strix]
MDLKPEANRVAEAGERLEEGILTTMEKDKAIKIKNNHIKSEIEKQKRVGWYDNSNDEWTKRTQMQKDPPENHSDRDSNWTEDEVPQNQITAPQPKQSVKQTQRIQHVQIQPKQQAPVQIPRQRGTKDAPSNQDDIDEQEILQVKLAALQKDKEQYGISDSENDQQQKTAHKGGVKQRQKIFWRELKQLQASQQLLQQGKNYLNNMNVDISVIQGTIGQLTGLQPCSGAQSPSINAELRLKETGSISASNKERTDPQINEGQEDNAEEEEDEQTNETALIQSKDYRVRIISQLPVQENLGTQPYNSQGLNAFSQMDKDNPGLALVGVQVKLKKGRGSKKSKTEGLNASEQQNQGNNAQAQTQTTSTVPKHKVTPKEGTKKAKQVISEPENSNDEDEWEQSPWSGRDVPTKGDQRRDLHLEQSREAS